MAGLPVLYDYYADNCSWRTRIVLHWKGIPHESKSVSLQARENYAPEFLKLNPLGQIPVLLIDGHCLTQSVAIAEYLEETHPERPILPKDPFQRAQVRMIVEIITSYLQPLQNPKTAQRHSSDPAAQLQFSLYFFTKGMAALETFLLGSSGRYCVGDEVTFADMALYPQVFRASRLAPDLEQYPTVMRIYEELHGLEAFQTAHAENHKDCPAAQRTGGFKTRP